MSEQWVKVMDVTELKDGKRIVHTEIIRQEDLSKVYKDCGNEGKAIVFEWYDHSTKTARQWRYEYHTTEQRDTAFDHYELLLTDMVIAE